jgi:hypothetical protein
MKRARIYVIYGQGGWLTSIGMSNLASRLAKLFPLSVVTIAGYFLILAMLGGSLYALFQITHTLGELQ